MNPLMLQKDFKVDLLIFVKDEDYNETVLAEKWKFTIMKQQKQVIENEQL